MICEHSKEFFYKFVKMLNTHHPSITVKAELSSKSMQFLDAVTYKGNRFKETGTFDTRVYFKPTDTLELLHKKSHHSNHTFKGSSQRCTTRNCKLCSTQVVVESGKTMGAYWTPGIKFKFLPHKIVIQLTIFTV